MYREVTGDLFTLRPTPDALVNTVNCVGAMGRGIALAFKQRAPQMYLQYRDECRLHRLHPGTCWLYRPTHGPLVVNMAVKDDWRQAARMPWIEGCLQELVTSYQDWGIRSIALPAVGAQNGWLPWPPIHQLIRYYLDDPALDLTSTLVLYRP